MRLLVLHGRTEYKMYQRCQNVKPQRIIVLRYVYHVFVSYTLAPYNILKFIYSEKTTQFCKIFPLLFTVSTVVKSKGKISQNFDAFSEYMNFTTSVMEIEVAHTALWGSLAFPLKRSLL